MLRFFVRLVLLIAAVAAGRFAFEKAANLQMFALKDVVISTNGYFDPDTLVVLSGLEKGKSIFKQDITFAADMISRQKGVVSCSVDRGILSDINVDVEFAEPSLLINANSVFGLSKEGIVLPVNELTPDLPLVTGRKFKGARRYEQIEDPDIAYALDLYNTLNSRSPELCKRLSEINFKEKKLIIIYLSPDGTAVVLNKCYSESDIYRLDTLMNSGILKGNRIFDLRFGDVIVESSKKRGTL
ncbi:MAG: FtsQ-type POTRA domain-containing protein [Candidatus Zixiibacteriota bacterium]|nr:MAG: FtsQ-type POTRA domain-containing protein [candidate division Zixibacteria bacterium]